MLVVCPGSGAAPGSSAAASGAEEVFGGSS